MYKVCCIKQFHGALKTMYFLKPWYFFIKLKNTFASKYDFSSHKTSCNLVELIGVNNIAVLGSSKTLFLQLFLN